MGSKIVFPNFDFVAAGDFFFHKHILFWMFTDVGADRDLEFTADLGRWCEKLIWLLWTTTPISQQVQLVYSRLCNFLLAGVNKLLFCTAIYIVCIAVIVI